MKNSTVNAEKVLAGVGLYDDILYMMEREVDRLMRSYISPEQKVEEYVYEDLQTMIKELHSTVPQLASTFDVADIQNMRFEPMYNKIKDYVIEAYKNHEIEIINFYNQVVSDYNAGNELQEAFASSNIVRSLEKDVLLKVVDSKWIDHLHNIDMLRDGIGLRAYGQKDPLIEYKKKLMIYSIK